MTKKPKKNRRLDIKAILRDPKKKKKLMAGAIEFLIQIGRTT